MATGIMLLRNSQLRTLRPLTHALAYSFVGIQTLYLATNYPEIYWNCACLIVKAGGADLIESDIEEENIDENEEEIPKKKKKNKTTDYGKISSAMGDSKSKGITILPPDINESALIFKPSIKKNAILYGLKGISRIGTELVYTIFANRPYTSIEDFMNKVKINKTQMISLIKAGTFDNLYEGTREDVMNHYLTLIADQKKRITLQNMQMLAKKELIPQELDIEKRLFFFNKYLKKNKDGDYYILDTVAAQFYTKLYGDKNLENLVITDEEQSAKIKQVTWDRIYKAGMEPVREWMKKNQQEILTQLNNSLLDDVKEKYATGNISKWEMDSLSFYYHDHELAHLKTQVYDIDDFEDLESNEIEKQFYTKTGDLITMLKIHRIAGTVIDKDKNKSEVKLLTTTGVVTVKVWKNQFAQWDKQVSELGADGKKHVVEKSWFTRGTKLVITGVKRDDTFVPKKYKTTSYPLFERIDELSEDGFILKSTTERKEII